MKINPLVPLILGALWYPVLSVNGASFIYHFIYLVVLGAKITSNQNPKIKRDVSILAIILFFMFAIIKILSDNDFPFNDLKNMITLLFIFLTSTIFIMPSIIKNNEYRFNGSKTIFFIFYLNFLISITDASNLTQVGSLLIGVEGYRIIGIFGGTSYGGFAAAILTIYCITYSKNSFRKSLVLLLGGIAIGLTGSRSAFLGLLIFVFLTMNVSWVKRIILLLFFGGILILLGDKFQAINNIPLLFKIDYIGLMKTDFSTLQSIDHFTSSLLDDLFADGQAGSAKKRIGLVYFSILSILSGTNILDFGLWGYGFHNSFLTIWVVLGFIPFLLFIIPFYIAIRFSLKLFKNYNLTLIKVFFASVTFSVLIHIFFMDDIGNRFVWSLFLPSIAYFTQSAQDTS